MGRIVEVSLLFCALAGIVGCTIAQGAPLAGTVGGPDDNSALSAQSASQLFDRAMQLLLAPAASADNLSNGLGLLRSAADQGSPIAQDRLALALAQGQFGLEINLPEAVDFYQKAIDASDDLTAMNRLADLYRTGAPTLSAAPSEALDLYRRATDLGSSSAKKKLGDMLIKGEGGVADVAAGVKLVAEVADAGDAGALLQLGDYYASPDYGILDLSRAVTYYQRAADSASPAAMKRLADLYRGGSPTLAPDLAKALGLYRRASDLGNVAAKRALGDMLIKGEGEVADIPGGLKLVAEAADAGDIVALGLLGDYYATARYGLLDISRAASYYQKAVDSGNAGAMTRLADFYRTGIATLPIDPQKAMTLYRHAAALGSIVAKRKLGDMLVRGQGGAADVRAGVELVTAAAESGDATAAVQLGDYYVTAAYGIVDVQRAVGYYQKASDAGNTAAMAKLADLYASGAPSLPPDPEKARVLYQQAANLGDPAAKKKLAALLVTAVPKSQAANVVPESSISVPASGGCDVTTSIAITDFDTNSAALSPKTQSVLALLPVHLRTPECILKIDSYSSSVGPSVWNHTLAEMRAQSVFKYLSDAGAKFRSHVINAVGETDQFGPAPASNRRVIITISAP